MARSVYVTHTRMTGQYFSQRLGEFSAQLSIVVSRENPTIAPRPSSCDPACRTHASGGP
jgi:hypothetical protein